MLWRPVGWEPPYKEEYMSPTKTAKLQAVTHNLAYEHGADAMLSSLRRKGFHIVPNTLYTAQQIGVNRPTGTVVFIPDDDKE
mgnify:CR=1 FL=1